ncbi:hypothetical protein NL676_030225 [Syzygium grande]|nr:hypothetical protein NL676_030225 [Syzygium grande]
MVVPSSTRRRNAALLLLLLPPLLVLHLSEAAVGRRVIEVKGAPESVVWVVQLSDLHFSVHHPLRAAHFKTHVAPALSLVNPSLVLVTGDLTDGKSKDLLTMKLNEEEWVEYRDVMEDVARRSGLHKSLFYDLRGNHDNFGVNVEGGSLDFFSKYSINAELGRTGNINSVTLQAGERKHLFVGLDSTMSVSTRGPTNLFGHPTDQLLAELDSELSQWDSLTTRPVTKISFGHFPLSFSATSSSGKSLRDIFLKHSLSAYLCGHLHTRFGKNLKRHHQSSDRDSFLHNLFQLNIHQVPTLWDQNCSFGAPPYKEFWEWEMGDWRKSRAMRILAIDSGHVSYLDINFESGVKETIIVPTFPLDSRFMSAALSHHRYECQYMVPSSYETIRALVFSVSPIASVVARVYDSRDGDLSMVMEAHMTKHEGNASRGNFYSAVWNYRAFEDPSPDRYWLQIKAIDMAGKSSLTELRPFSINGLTAQVSWTWKEFSVMGCQWAGLYFPLFWSALCFMFSILLIPKALQTFLKKQYSYMRFATGKGIVGGIAWFLQELCNIPGLWFGILGYLFFLLLFPWLSGQIFSNGGMGYMTYKGWVVKDIHLGENHEFLGFPEVMVIVLPHLVTVVLPMILVCGALAAERGFHQHICSTAGKKKDDYGQEKKRSLKSDTPGIKRLVPAIGNRWLRKLLVVVCLAVCCKHFMNCRALMKAYEMNPFINFPGYSLSVPVLLAYAVYKTRSNDQLRH